MNPSQRIPEVVRVKVPRELLINVHDVDVALAVIPHDSPTPLALVLVALDVDPQAAVHLEPQQDLVVDGVPPARGLIALHALQLQLLEPGVQVCGLLRQPLRLDLGVARRLGRPELLRVEAGNLAGVVGRRVAGHEVVVLRGERVELPRELLEGLLGVADPQVARLLQRRQRLVDPRDGELVRVDVEVFDGVVDKLDALDGGGNRGFARGVLTVAGSSESNIVTDVFNFPIWTVQRKLSCRDCV